MPYRIQKIFLWMLLFIPISWYFAFFTENRTIAFIVSILSIIPLARIIGYATNEIILQTNPALGGLVNATFGNAIEIMIALFALSKGLVRVVQASLIGSIIGNILLLIGMSVFFGGFRYKEQRFNKDSVGVSSTMLIIAVTGMVIPAVYAVTAKAAPLQIMIISNAVAFVLALTYISGLVFAFFTHKHLFDASDEIKATKEKPAISVKRAVLTLLIVTVVVAFQSELLVRNVQFAAVKMGLTQTFIGVAVIAIITNIAEKATAVHFALKNRLNVALEIGLSSATQIALFVVPVLVFVSQLLHYGFTLVFSMFEVISVFLAVMIVNYLSGDGRCNWLEGAQLISVYMIIVIAFYFV